MNLDLKQVLKTLKLNEANISMALGALVILVLAIFVVKYFRNQTTSQILPSASSQTRQTHKVAKGESLWKISMKYYNSGFNWVNIAKANNIVSPNKIEVGQELVIPETETAKTENPAVQKQQDSNLSITGATYEVTKGDTIWKIAVRAYQDGYKWPLIAKENKLTNPNIIHPGNILIIPR